MKILAARRVDQPQSDGQLEVGGVVVEPQRREHRLAVLEGDLVGVDLGDEELRAVLDVGIEVGRGATGDIVVVVVQPGLQPRGLRGAEHHDIVLANGELSLHGHPTIIRPGGAVGRAAGAGHRGAVVVLLGRARVLLPILHQPRGGELVNLGEQVVGQRLDVGLLKHHRHRHDHGEVFGRALIVVLDGQHRSVAVAHHHRLGRVGEQVRLAAPDVKAAEGVGLLGHGEAGKPHQHHHSEPFCQRTYIHRLSLGFKERDRIVYLPYPQSRATSGPPVQ